MNKELKSIKLANLKLKCSSLKIKQYGTKLVVFDRIKKHYADNKLGKFNLKDLLAVKATPVNDKAKRRNKDKQGAFKAKKVAVKIKAKQVSFTTQQVKQSMKLDGFKLFYDIINELCVKLCQATGNGTKSGYLSVSSSVISFLKKNPYCLKFKESSFIRFLKDFKFVCKIAKRSHPRNDYLIEEFNLRMVKSRKTHSFCEKSNNNLVDKQINLSSKIYYFIKKKNNDNESAEEAAELRNRNNNIFGSYNSQ